MNLKDLKVNDAIWVGENRLFYKGDFKQYYYYVNDTKVNGSFVEFNITDRVNMSDRKNKYTQYFTFNGVKVNAIEKERIIKSLPLSKDKMEKMFVPLHGESDRGTLDIKSINIVGCANRALKSSYINPIINTNFTGFYNLDELYVRFNLGLYINQLKTLPDHISNKLYLILGENRVYTINTHHINELKNELVALIKPLIDESKNYRPTNDELIELIDELLYISIDDPKEILEEFLFGQYVKANNIVDQMCNLTRKFSSGE